MHIFTEEESRILWKIKDSLFPVLFPVCFLGHPIMPCCKAKIWNMKTGEQKKVTVLPIVIYTSYVSVDDCQSLVLSFLQYREKETKLRDKTYSIWKLILKMIRDEQRKFKKRFDLIIVSHYNTRKEDRNKSLHFPQKRLFIRVTRHSHFQESANWVQSANPGTNSLPNFPNIPKGPERDETQNYPI